MINEKYRLAKVSTDFDKAAYDEIRGLSPSTSSEGGGTNEDDYPDQPSEGAHRLLLFHRAEPVGAACIEYLQSSMVAIRVATVSEDRRREGHGRVLIQMVEDFAHAMGGRRMVVNAPADSMEFFSLLGYIVEKWSDPSPIRRNAVQMAKRLHQFEPDGRS